MPKNTHRVASLVLAVGAVLVLATPSWAAKKGPKISVENDPSLKEGSPGIVLIEIGDFQCPYCGKGVREVLPLVYDKFVRTGKVEMVFLDYPIQQIHPQAFKAAEAAACAGEQKLFWEMHHQLFGNQGALAPAQLAEHAEGLGLDMAAFGKCLESGRHAPEIRADMRVVQNLGITGTPAYVLGRRVDGDKVEVLDVVKGLPPYEVLEQKIAELLGPQPAAGEK